jgi:hypothetical protein
MGGKGDSVIRVNRLTRIAEERQDSGTHERDVEHAPKASAAALCGGIGSKSVRARQADATGTKRRENFNLSRAGAESSCTPFSKFARREYNHLRS